MAEPSAAEPKPDTMQVKVVSQDGTEIFFKCK